jgi:uncharacterized protein
VNPVLANVLASPPPWWVLGPCLGLLVVGLLAALNVRMGIVGGWSEVLDRALGRASAVAWKGWFFVGVILGGLLFRLLAGRVSTGVGDGYGWLSRELDSPLAVGVALVLAGGLIGYGAKTAGGCTSGNGLGGTSFASPAGFASTATFMGVAVLVTLLSTVIT